MSAGALVLGRSARGAAPAGLDEVDLNASLMDRAPRVLGPIAIPYAVSHFGVRWEGDEGLKAEIRWRETEEAWSHWQGVGLAHDLGDRDRGVWLSGLVLAPDAGEVEVRVLQGMADRFRLVVIDAYQGASPGEAARFRTSNADRTSGRPDPGVAIVSRRDWGANESLRKGHPAFAPTTRMSVHHTVTPNDDPDPAATVRAILAYHTQSRGWDDIGYNFVIDAGGRIYEGRWAHDYAPGETPTGEDGHGHGVIGAHTGQDNPGTLGVALLGDFTSVPPSPAALDSLQALLAWKAATHDIDPLASTTWSTGEHSTIIGHRDANPTACPGNHLHSALPSVRQEVAYRLASSQPGTPAPGYWLLTGDGQVFHFGEAPVPASATAPAPALSLVPTASGQGYWVLSGDGGVIPFGDARPFGSTEGMTLNAPVVRLEPTPSGLGYWIVAADGGVFTFGDAWFFGSTADMRLGGPVVALVATPSGAGYWIVAADGGVFAFGDAQFLGSAAGSASSAPVVGAAAHPTGDGYWLLTADGRVLPFGKAPSLGDVPGGQERGPARSVQLRSAPSGAGYYVLGADGSLFTFGDARFYGTAAGRPDSSPAVDLALCPSSPSRNSSSSPDS